MRLRRACTEHPTRQASNRRKVAAQSGRPLGAGGRPSRIRPRVVCGLTRALDRVHQILALEGVDVHKHHAKSVTSIRRETEAAHVGPQHDIAGWLVTRPEVQEDEATPWRIYVRGKL